MSVTRAMFTAIAGAAVATADHAHAQCEPAWLGGFGSPEVVSQVTHIRQIDQPHGAALLAGGWFQMVAGVRMQGTAIWNGEQWSPFILGSPAPRIFSSAMFDDGRGTALYLAGAFSEIGGVSANSIARWDGARCHPLGDGAGGELPVIFSLCVFDDGSGPALYSGGLFTHAGGVESPGVARWDGTAWSAVGNGLPTVTSEINGVRCLAVHDDHRGAALYAGGAFFFDGEALDMVAQWTGERWTRPGCGIRGSGVVTELVSHDDGGGAALYAGGDFDWSECGRVLNVARWDGTAWMPVGAGIDAPVLAMESVRDSGVPTLYALRNGASARVVAWDGSNWAEKGDELPQVPYPGWVDLAWVEVAGRRSLYVGSSYSTWLFPGIARLDGSRWLPLGAGFEPRFPGAIPTIPPAITSIGIADDGSGPALYVGGELHVQRTQGIARWDHGRWEALGGGLRSVNNLDPPDARAIVDFDDGAGRKVIVGGSFRWAGETVARNIAAWDGHEWHALGDGVDGRVLSLAVYDDGSGSALYVGGNFTEAGGLSVRRLARWQSGAWSDVGIESEEAVRALAVFDDGSGPALYVSGAFREPSLHRVARWDGKGWSRVGDIEIGRAQAFAAFDDGTGPALYAAGWFDLGTWDARVAKWDGERWSPVGPPMGSAPEALLVHDDGRGPALYAAGGITTLGRRTVHGILRWTGQRWVELGEGIYDPEMRFPTAHALASYDDGSGPALWLGGYFLHAGGLPASGVAKWGCPSRCEPCDANCDGTIDAQDIEAFVELLMHPGVPACSFCAGDVNGDGSVDGFDIEPFVKCLDP